ncbi:hypothetical protein CHU98_g8051 [Xylaria longipes]|nr:hypothetical protein CHU98_g8051 [Xylaria longipes]
MVVWLVDVAGSPLILPTIVGKSSQTGRRGGGHVHQEIESNDVVEISVARKDAISPIGYSSTGSSHLERVEDLSPHSGALTRYCLLYSAYM